MTATDFCASIRASAEKRRAERDHRLSVPCPQPRCPAGVGEECRTPNGWGAYHKARERAVAGEQPKPARKPRLTEAQAGAIEIAAEAGQFFAAGRYAAFRGDAARRAVGDALLRHGLMELAEENEYGERTLRLTAEGWRVYWHHRLPIRRLPDERHAVTCPCIKEEAQ